ncbi:MAG: AAA family ATPase [Planctomycetota bacterium]|nr:AAA family ATPase [Planctomycetota bacterium]
MDTTLRVFVSSPGDVAEERVIAKRVLERLAADYLHVVNIDSIFWEHEPLLATETFQKQIVRPSETDIVVTILWSRLGTRLPTDIKRPDGSTYDSGTEFEFEDAVNGREARGAPDLIVYRKTAEPVVSLKDSSEVRNRLDQKQALDSFIDRWFHGEDGTLVAAFHPFVESGDFELLLETHLRKLVERRLQDLDVELKTGQARVHTAPSWTAGSPFRGLDVFQMQHAPIFFGRTRAIGDVINALRRVAADGRAFLLVLGVSGCGKSSLVRAGVMPMLTQPGVLEGVGLWRHAIMRPSDSLGDLHDGLAAALLRDGALPELAADGTTTVELAKQLRDLPQAADRITKGALSQAASQLKSAESARCQPEARLVLVVDQLEEIFTLDNITPHQRAEFIIALASLSRSGRVFVIVTLRNDFYHRCVEIPELVELKEGAGQYDLLPPTAAEIAQMIRLPAQSAGLQFDKHPVSEEPLDDILRDAAAGDPECLPLLEFTLEELFKRRQDDCCLTYQAYEQLGGVEGALTSRADELFNSLDEKVRGALPSVFRKLVTVGTGETDTPTRRNARLHELRATPEAATLVDKFVEARLLITDKTNDGQAVVRVTHEALLTKWSPLVEWFAADCELLRIRSRVSTAAMRWQSEGRPRDLLLPTGKPLDEALQLRRSGFDLDQRETNIIDASADWSRTTHRIKVAAIILLILLAVAAVAAGLIANRSREVAERLADESRERLVQIHVDSGLRQLESDDALASLPWFVEALDLENTPTHQAKDGSRLHRIRLATVLRECPRLEQILFHEQMLSSLSFSPDGQRLLTAAGKEARIWNTTTGELIRTVKGKGGLISTAVFSPDGRQVITGFDKGVQIWNSESGQANGKPLEHPGTPQQIEFSRDGRRFVTLSSGMYVGQSEVRVWDVGTSDLLGEPIKGPAEVKNVALNSDGSRLIICGGNFNEQGFAQVWDVDAAEVLTAPLLHFGTVVEAAFSSDERHVATACGRMETFGVEYGQAVIWDVATGKPISEQPMWHRSPVRRIAYSPEGDRLLTVTHAQHPDEVEIHAWDARTGTERIELGPKTDAMIHAEFGHGSQRIVLAAAQIQGEPQQARVWDLETGQPVTPPLEHSPHNLHKARFSPDCSLVVTTYGGFQVAGYARIWDAKTGQPVSDPLTHSTAALEAIFNHDGTQLVTIANNFQPEHHSLRLWDVATGKAVSSLLEHTSQIETAVFNPDGTRLVSVGGDFTTGTGEARLWDTTTGQLAVEPLEHRGHVKCAAFSNDGRSLVTGTIGSFNVPSYAQVWDTETGHTRGMPVSHGGQLNHLAFSEDGRLLVTCSEDQTARVWDARTGTPLTPPLAQQMGVQLAVFNRDATLVATAAGKSARVWDIRTGQPITPALKQDYIIAHLHFDEQRGLLIVGSYHPRTFPARHGALITASESTSGQWYASFSEDRRRVVAREAEQARVWDTLTGQPLTPPLPADGTVVQAVFSPDGRRVATATTSGTVRIWDLSHHAPSHARLGRGLEYKSVFRVGFQLQSVDLAPNRRPADELRTVAHVLSSQRIERTGGSVHLEPKQLRDAWQSINESEMLSVSPADVLLWHQREAADCELTDQWQAAATHLDWLIEAEPDEALHVTRRAWAWAELSRWHEAAEHYAKASQLGADDIDTTALYALALLSSGDHNQYRTQCRHLVERLITVKDDRKFIAAAAVVLLQPDSVDDYAVLVERSQRSIRLKPLNSDWHQLLGVGQLRAGQAEDAATQITKAMELQRNEFTPPDQPVGTPMDWLWMAMTQAQLGHDADAQQWFDRAHNAIELHSQGFQYTGSQRSWHQRQLQNILLQEVEMRVGGDGHDDST